MYLSKLKIFNLRALRSATLEFESGAEAGWHVILGENGSGKTTIVRAIAMGALGPMKFMSLDVNWGFLIRGSAGYAILSGVMSVDPVWDPRSPPYLSNRIKFAFELEADERSADESDEEPLCWEAASCEGHFSSAFGPFRRFEGNRNYRKIHDAHPILARHLSAFHEDFALTECLEWICKFYVLTLENRADSKLLDQIKRFVQESELLPDGAHIADIKSDSVTFIDSFGTEVPVEELSDGFRSILSLTFELIRQLVQCYGADRVFAENDSGELIIAPPGVVAIDEIDTHLHPSWQARIGDWFTRRFPNIQFIVTTHSPFICRAAKTIWHLASPKQRREGAPDIQEITGEDKNRLIYGNIIEAYESAGFDLASLTRSEAGRKKKDRLALLARKKLRGLEMSPEESEEFNELVKLFPGSVNGA